MKTKQQEEEQKRALSFARLQTVLLLPIGTIAALAFFNLFFVLNPWSMTFIASFSYSLLWLILPRVTGYENGRRLRDPQKYIPSKNPLRFPVEVTLVFVGSLILANIAQYISRQ